MGIFDFSHQYFSKDFILSSRTFNVSYLKCINKQLVERFNEFANLFAEKSHFEFFMFVRLIWAFFIFLCNIPPTISSQTSKLSTLSNFSVFLTNMFKE